MAVTVTQDITYPLIGQKVTLKYSGETPGNRVRFRIISKPATSSFLLYTAREPNYLTDNTIEPDVEGKYVLEAVEEEFKGYIPRFSNDQGESPNFGQVDYWEEVAAYTHNLYVGLRMKRQLGIAPDEVTLTVATTTTDAWRGVLTAYYDKSLAPQLSDPTSDRAKQAMGSRRVLAALERIGGDGYRGTADYISTVGTLSTDFHQPVYDWDMTNATRGLVCNLYKNYTYHMGQTSDGYELLVGAHQADDSASAITAADATDVTSLVTLLVQAKSKYNGHIAKGGSVHPSGADNINTISGTASNEATSIAFVNEWLIKFSAHRVTFDLAGGVGHYRTGDTSDLSRPIEYTATTLSEAILLANDLKEKFNRHIVISQITVAYHVRGDAYNSPTFSTHAMTAPTSAKDFVPIANELLKRIQAHSLNRDDEQQEIELPSNWFHYTKDTSCDLAKIPQASTADEAIVLIERLYYLLHMHKGTSVPHGLDPSLANSGGSKFIMPTGVHLLNFDFMIACDDVTFGSPPNGLQSKTDLISYSGFTKA